MIYYYRLAINYLMILQLFDSFDNKRTMVQGKQKYGPIIYIYVTYVTIRIKQCCLYIFYNLTSLYVFQVMSNQIK